MDKNTFVEIKILKLREYGQDFSDSMEEEVKTALIEAWNLGYRNGESDKIDEVNEFYGSR